MSAIVEVARSDAPPLLAVEGLVKHYLAPRRWLQKPRPPVRAVDGVSFTLARGETLALVGESGCGKTTTAKSVLRLVEPTSGSVRFEGEELLTLDAGRMRERRRDLQIIFQDPYASLNPRMTAGEIVGEPLRNFAQADGDARASAAAPAALANARGRRDRVAWLFEKVGLRAEALDRYPHEFSGGQRQRIGIARALALQPRLIVCDEPVSALDVSVQATVLNLLADLRDRLGLAYLFISHDLSVVVHIADRIAVMYAGMICEEGPTDAVLAPPYHPYTAALLSAIPVVDPESPRPTRIRPRVQAGSEVPHRGCVFAHRCAHRIEGICDTAPPPVIAASARHRIWCHLPLEELQRMPSALLAQLSR